jgi:hypothetical protein
VGQLHLPAENLPAQGFPSNFDLMAEAYVTDLLPGNILKAIQTNSWW